MVTSSSTGTTTTWTLRLVISVQGNAARSDAAATSSYAAAITTTAGARCPTPQAATSRPTPRAVTPQLPRLRRRGYLVLRRSYLASDATGTYLVRRCSYLASAAAGFERFTPYELRP